uniref:Uncharacterized protein n=1 Tax=Pyricularia oryzae (strain P131) TaxID=1143193 RepID=L7IR08_PYRO1
MVNLGRRVVRNLRPNGAVATAVIQDIIRALVRRMKKCLMYTALIVLRLRSPNVEIITNSSTVTPG